MAKREMLDGVIDSALVAKLTLKDLLALKLREYVNKD